MLRHWKLGSRRFETTQWSHLKDRNVQAVLEVSDLEDTTTTLSPNFRNQIPNNTALYPENGYLKISYIKRGNIHIM